MLQGGSLNGKLPTSLSPSIAAAFPVSFSPGRPQNKDTLREATNGLRLNFRCHIKPPSLSSSKGKWVSVNSELKKTANSSNLIWQRLESDKDEDLDDTLSAFCKNLSPKLQTLVLNKQRRWDRLLRVFEFFKAQYDYVPNVIHYKIVLRAIGRARRWDKLRLYWVEMAEEDLLGLGTYGFLVDLYGNAGLRKEALLCVKHMRLRGIFPDEGTMHSVVKVLKSAGEYDRAITFFEDWCAGRVDLDGLGLDSIEDSFDSSSSSATTAERSLLAELAELPSPRSGGSLDPDEGKTRKLGLTSSYNSMIDLYAKVGRVKDAVDVFEKMFEAGVEMNTVTLNTLIFAIGTHQNLKDAELLMDQMQERGIKPNTKTYNTLLSLYAKADNVGEASRCYQRIKEAGLLPDSVTYRAVLQMYCERKMVGESEAVIEDMEKSSGCIESFSIPRIVRMYLDTGSLTKAVRFLSKCNLSDGPFHPKIRTSIVDAFAERGLWGEAETVFYSKTDMARRRHADEYNAMIKAYKKAKLYDEAYSLFTGMRKDGTRPDASTYNTLIEMYSEGNIPDRARVLLEEMQGEGFTPESIAISSLILSYVRGGQLSSAQLVYQEMGRLGLEPDKDVLDSLTNGT